MAIKYDKFLDRIREKDSGSNIPEYDNADPTSPVEGDIWVKRTFVDSGIAGEYRMLGLLMLRTGEGASTYQLSYKSSLGTIVRTSLS